MDVTTKNFEDVLEIFPEILDRAQFVSIDTEFTGLHIDGNTFNYFDTLNEFYQVNRVKATNFLVVQYGICLFEYHPVENKYTHRAYNFYVYPSESKRNFSCQVSCMAFLAKHGFDFNKLFSNGIPYLTQDEKEAKVEHLQVRMEKQVADSPIIKVPKDTKKVIDGVMKKIKDFVKGKGSSTLPRYNSFIKRLIYQSAKDEFGEQVLLESNKDGTMSMAKGLTDEEKRIKRDQKWENEKKQIEDDDGFSKIIRMIIDSGKTVIGHNVFIDLIFTMHQFLKPLPESFEEFREITKDLFPRIMDTKHIATAANFREFAESALADVFEGFDKDEIPVVEPATEDCGYKLENARPHEAAYDCYITGLAFLAMVGRIGKLNTTNIFKTLPVSPLLAPYLNKLSVPRMHEISCLDLDGEYRPPRRQDVFHITFPEDWKRDEILNHFKDYGFINLRWIDNKTAFIGIGTDALGSMKQRITRNKQYDCQVQTYEDFRRGQHAQKPGDSGDMRKRPSSEDLGVVVSPKRNCTFEIPGFE